MDSGGQNSWIVCGLKKIKSIRRRKGYWGVVHSLRLRRRLIYYNWMGRTLMTDTTVPVTAEEVPQGSQMTRGLVDTTRTWKLFAVLILNPSY